MQKRLKHYVLAAMLLLAPIAASAQVTIGNGNPPQPFSVLELISNDTQGLRLPQMTTTERNNMKNKFGTKETNEAMGLQIFNTSTRCVETWNGSTWITQCPPGGPYVEPIIEIPNGVTSSDWTENRWVGAFWRNGQTGERIIYAKNTHPWSVSVDENCALWITLDEVRKNNDKLWTDELTDAEDYQITNGVSELTRTGGDILFRIGAKSTNPTPATPPTSGFKAMNPDTGEIEDSWEPRYGTITLKIDANNNGTYETAEIHTLYMRQGEAADYLFGPDDDVTGTMTGTERPLAVKVSPYNLTNADLRNDSPALGVPTGINDGVFVEFPTQAGAFWQWGTDLAGGGNPDLLRHAYHPTKPTTAISGWDSDYNYDTNNNTWDEFTDDNSLETCPSGFRRPTVFPSLSTTNSIANASGSELMQSLFEITIDASTIRFRGNLADYRYFGYYADGFFDRLPIETLSGTSPRPKAAVSADNEKVAYVGLLFTNPNTNASLFIPFSGERGVNNGSLINAGAEGNVWTSSAGRSSDGGWGLDMEWSKISMHNVDNTTGMSVRCVTE